MNGMAKGFWRKLGLMLLLGLAAGAVRSDAQTWEAEAAPSSSVDESAEPSARQRPDLRPDPLLLPQWTEEDAAALDAGRPANLGGGLWPEELYPLEWTPPLPRRAPSRGETAGPWSEDLLAAYRHNTSRCVDPQQLLMPGERRELEAQMAQVAAVVPHPWRLWVLAPGQWVPESVADAQGGRPSIAVAVWGEPGRLQWIGDGLSEAALEKVRQRAAQAATPYAQLQETVNWLGAALFRWEAEVSAAEAAAAAQEAFAARVRRSREWFLGVGVVFCMVAGGGVAVWCRFRLVPKPVYFPEQTVPARLAAPYCNGAGAAVRW